MVKIVVTSDIHLGITTEDEVRALVARIAAEQPSLTVLAGDVGEGYARFQTCLRLFSQVPGSAAVLAGNHDVWAVEQHPSAALWLRDLREAVHAAGALWLEGTSWCTGAVGVTGSMAWYDYSAADPGIGPFAPAHFQREKGKRNFDGRNINWAWSDTEFAQQCGDALCQTLDHLDRDPAIAAVLVVTHVPIFEPQMLRKAGDARWGFGNAYFGNLTLGRRVLEHSRKLRAAVSGHTHIGRSGTLAHPSAPGVVVPVRVLASDYHAPAYCVITTDDLLAPGSAAST